MKKNQLLILPFDLEFDEYESNRMYPPEYGKDFTMLKPTSKHIESIVRCEQLLKSGLNSVVRQQFRNNIEEDLLALSEVKQMLYQVVANPTLPFLEAEPLRDEPALDKIENEPDGAF